MAASDSVLLAKLFYYAREKQYNTIQNTIVECKEKHGADPTLTFFDGISLLMQGMCSPLLLFILPVLT